MYSIHHVLIVLVTSSTAFAAPFHLVSRASSGGPGDGGGSGPMSIQPQIWIPLVVVAALFILGTIVACSGRSLRRSALLSWGNGAAQAAGVTTGTTPAAGAVEITADQLAGSQGRNSTATGTNGARRARRARRTPSQMSTHSLPVYQKEPGEQEIVIGRGEDGEDGIPITVEMPPLDEHETDTPYGSVDLTRPSMTYSPVPHTPHDLPLLQGGDLDSRQHLSPDDRGMATRASFDSTMSSADGSSQHYLDDAPAYETVILNDEHTSTTSPTYPPAAAVPAAAQERTSTEHAGTTRRRSVFASIFNHRHSRGPSATSPPSTSPEPRSSSGHTREGSGPSVLSVPVSEREQRRSRMIRHQPSHSGSGSMFSLLSRTRSNGNLNGAEALTSPSMISLQSISAPLTHTLVKTEFAYPRGGPTPDQLRLIASRESVMRFGKPYGADAIAYASSSRVELEPPPGFEEVAGPSNLSSPPQGRDTPSSGSHDEEDAHASEPHASSPSDVVQLEAPAEPRVLADDVDMVESPITAVSSASSSPPAEGTSSSAAIEDAPPSVSSSSVSTEQPGPTSPSSHSPTRVIPSSVATSNAPPSAFKAAFASTPVGGSFPDRATSRASSYMSYATAEESLNTPTADDSQFDLSGREDDAYESAADTEPPTPRITPRHMHEESDTTIHG
ncbi:hypothetical protein K466DRAFT_504794 [Polyporus arcularius HHB13444]|uniref:Proteophosphoglycan ppg4 n=1 Tax=Polyporus arcularius HHB13444 TaxID=1314778 RepID=A0A5C3NSC1_9APHY|nr:hypothetical protein K466DRAFT_504794 [Polyporus arcularius HHB13444]